MTLTPDTIDPTAPGGELPVVGAEPAADPPAASPWQPQFRPVFRRIDDRIRNMSGQSWFTLIVVVGCILFVFNTCHPTLIFSNSTPTGGDMGAHLVGPHVLMNNLFHHGMWNGWWSGWYDGFPLFEFYMVVPALMVVFLDLGVRNPFLLVPAVAFVVSFMLSGFFVPALHRWRKVLFGVGLFWLVCTIPVPYNQAFKLVTISGLLGLPLAAWAFGKLTDLPFPGPPILALGSLFIIYNREPNLNGGTGNIIGGNMASTMAGEFCFMISLVFCLLYLGFLVKGLRTGKYRGTAAVFLALTGLCHLIPVFFAGAATVAALIVWPGRQRLKWAAVVLPVGGLLAAFWIVPFELNHAFTNDMGWQKLPSPGAMTNGAHPRAQTIWDYILPHALWWPIALAFCGLVVSIVYRYRAGIFLAITAVGSCCAFVWVPQAQLWNARLLPFYYLSLFLLAAVGVSEVVRSIGSLVARDPDNPGPWATPIGATACVAFTLIFLGVPLNNLPWVTNPPTGGATWLGVFHRSYRNDVPGWAAWNYSGLEAKPAQVGPGGTLPAGQGGWPELHAMIATMAKLGTEPAHGCGRAFWEYSGDRLNTYGTPMGPMLLPYYTNNCIGSQEGLYFESSATTPYHFLTQCELSAQGSCAQRNLDYGTFNLDLGLGQLEMLGVKYYMAVTPTAVDAANDDPSIKQVAVAGPWHVYQLPAATSAMVTPLTNQPVVMKNIANGQGSWLDPSAAWYLDPNDWNVMMAESGPKSWQRITIPSVPVTTPKEAEFVSLAQTTKATVDGLPAPPIPGTSRTVGDRTLPALPRTALPHVTVSDIVTADNRISFNVDRVGTPVLVKTSYFPNWKVSGGEGPYRVTPNLMVVIPTSTHVSLHYGRTDADYLGMFMTLLGIASLIGLAYMAPVVMPEPKVRVRPAAAGPPPTTGGEPGVGPQIDFRSWAQAVSADPYGGPPPLAPSVPPAAPPHDWAAETPQGPATVDPAGSTGGSPPGRWEPPDRWEPSGEASPPAAAPGQTAVPSAHPDGAEPSAPIGPTDPGADLPE